MQLLELHHTLSQDYPSALAYRSHLCVILHNMRFSTAVVAASLLLGATARALPSGPDIFTDQFLTDGTQPYADMVSPLSERFVRRKGVLFYCGDKATW